VKENEQVNKLIPNDEPLLGFLALRRMKQGLGELIFPRFPVSRHLFNHLRWEVRAFWVQINNKLNPLSIYRIYKIRSGNNFSVNIACGGSARKGWVNLDLLKHRNLTLRYDCRKKLPFREETVARIRCEHFLEHLDYSEEAPFLLKSCYKSLKKGGVLRIVVPDAGRFLRAYQSHNKQEWLVLGWDPDILPKGFYARMDIINFIFRQEEEHRHAYDFETLSLLLKRAGFENIQKTEFGISFDPQLKGDEERNKVNSLYVEAIK
jgi:predicted SAM-dependent methyltransferase